MRNTAFGKLDKIFSYTDIINFKTFSELFLSGYINWKKKWRKNVCKGNL